MPFYAFSLLLMLLLLLLLRVPQVPLIIKFGLLLVSDSLESNPLHLAGCVFMHTYIHTRIVEKQSWHKVHEWCC